MLFLFVLARFEHEPACYTDGRTSDSACTEPFGRLTMGGTPRSAGMTLALDIYPPPVHTVLLHNWPHPSAAEDGPRRRRFCCCTIGNSAAAFRQIMVHYRPATLLALSHRNYLNPACLNLSLTTFYDP